MPFHHLRCKEKYAFTSGESTTSGRGYQKCESQRRASDLREAERLGEHVVRVVVVEDRDGLRETLSRNSRLYQSINIYWKFMEVHLKIGKSNFHFRNVRFPYVYVHIKSYFYMCSSY